MKKKLCFFFLIVALKVYSQRDYFIKEINFQDYETRKNLGREITVEVNDEKKVILNLKRPNLRTYHYFSYSTWGILPRSYEFVEVSKTYGSFNLRNPRLMEENIIFTIKNNGRNDSKVKYVFKLRNETSNNKEEKFTDLIINVIQPNPCNNEIIYDGKFISNERINLGGSITFNNSTITGSDISSNEIFIRNTRILGNTKISSKSCKENRIIKRVNNNLFEPINFENKVSTSKIIISPNPTSDYIEIKSEIKINDWYIYDINARIVLSGNNKNYLKISLNKLSPGIYYFKFLDSLGVLHEKTIIKNN